MFLTLHSSFKNDLQKLSEMCYKRIWASQLSWRKFGEISSVSTPGDMRKILLKMFLAVNRWNLRGYISNDDEKKLRRSSSAYWTIHERPRMTFSMNLWLIARPNYSDTTKTIAGVTWAAFQILMTATARISRLVQAVPSCMQDAFCINLPAPPLSCHNGQGPVLSRGHECVKRLLRIYCIGDLT